ncbi:MAG: apolipoprotein N-acyltransferase [Actinobacteria bacterium]|nr:apolipoprotein N-acyltransferase [Actinomycetota bacterium]
MSTSAPDSSIRLGEPSNLAIAQQLPETTSSRPVRLARLALPALLAGIALAASIPPWGFWILAFFGAGLLYWRLDGLGMRQRFLVGFLAGIGLFTPGLIWATSFNVAGGLVLIIFEACFLGLAGAATTNRAGRLLAFPGAFTLASAFRQSWPFGGLPLGGVALGQAVGPLAYTARLGGPVLVGACVWIGGAGLAQLVVGSRQAGSLASRAWGASALVVLAALGLAGWMAPNGGPATGHLRVAAIQGGGKRGLRAIQVNPDIVFRAQLAATDQLFDLPKDRRPEVVLWPEDVIALPGRLKGSYQDADVAFLAEQLHATLLAGVTEPVGTKYFRNKEVVWAPSGKVVASYEKVHRVPFGEYVPFRSIISHFANLSDIPRDAIPGTGTGMVQTPVGKLGIMISYEVFFQDRGRSATRAGAKLLLVPTNTSSYTTSQVPTQEIAASRLQAISEGRDLVQAAPTGYSAFITNDGQVLMRSVLARRQVIVDSVATRNGSTIFERFGSKPILVLGLAALLAGWSASYRKRRSGRRLKDA